MSTEEALIANNIEKNNNILSENDTLEQIKAKNNNIEDEEKSNQELNNDEKVNKTKNYLKTYNEIQNIEKEIKVNLNEKNDQDLNKNINENNIKQETAIKTQKSDDNNMKEEDDTKEIKIDEKEESISNKEELKNKEITKIPTKEEENTQDSKIKNENTVENNKIFNEQKILDKNELNDCKEDKKHKLSPSCLNKCVKWIIKLDIKSKNQTQLPANFKSQYTFEGKSIFFHKLEQSIINGLYNPQIISSSFYKNMAYQDILEMLKSDSSKRLDSNSQNSGEKLSSLRELLNVTYPIDNSKFNYSIIDANLTIKDNLKNLFLIEFDFSQIMNEAGQNFRKINDDCVERELDFILNGTFHDKKMFKNDLTFSVGYREIIKSMQFKIKGLQPNKLRFQKIKNNIFFGKVLNNTNFGVEFLAPSVNENSQNNFNAIVNSHIEINKIFIELTIPNNFIHNSKLNISNILEGATEDSNSISTKKTEINSPKKEENNANNSNPNSNKNLNFNVQNNFQNNKNNLSENTKNFLFNNNIMSPNPRILGINRTIPISPYLNNFQNLIYQQKYSPLINPNFHNNKMNLNMGNNNFQQIPNQNSFFSATPHYPLSPVPPQPQQIFCSPQTNTYSPLSASLMLMKMPYQNRVMQPQPLSINSPFNTSNYSSPYLGQNPNRNTPGLNSSNNHKNSGSFQNDNQVNNYVRRLYNSNHQTPLIMKTQKEEIMDRINLNQYMSPQSMRPSPSFNLGNNINLANFNLNNNSKINGSIYQLNPMNQQINQMGNIIPMTIRLKMFEQATKKEEVDRINKTLNTMNRERPNNISNNIKNNNININNMNNINNNINNFNNSLANNNIRTNIIKNNLPNINLNNTTNLNNFNNINQNKNRPKIPNISNIQNLMNINNNMNNINIMSRINNITNINNKNTMNNMNIIRKFHYENKEEKETQKIKNIFTLENQHKSNIDIFIKSVTPLIKKSTEENYLKVKIISFLDNLKIMSLFGLNTIYYNLGELVHMWYSLSLSSFSIKIINKQLISQIFEEIKQKKKINNLNLQQNEEISIIESVFRLYFTTEYLDITFIESKPDYFRKSYNSLIKSLVTSIPLFTQITLEDIDLNKSYFALLYSSVKIQKPFTPHSFIVYYNFTKEIIQENNNYCKQGIVGILPIKVNWDFFMQKITFNNNQMYNKQSMQQYGYKKSDNIPIINMVYQVINDIQKYARENSYDYELFLKLKNYNYK